MTQYAQPTNIKISVLLLTQNSERTIGETLQSLQDFDEVVVVDGGSQDRTLEILQRFPNVCLYQNPWPGFIPQRNFSLSKASHLWCFMIDSDETAPPGLYPFLQKAVYEHPQILLFRIIREEYFLGRPVLKAFGKSGYQERLLFRDRVTYGGGTHHSHFIDGQYVDRHHPLSLDLDPAIRIDHDKSYGLDEWLMKTPRFTILIAKEKLAAGKKANPFMILFTFFGTFLKTYLKSYREGRRGFIISVLEAVNKVLVKTIIYQRTVLPVSEKKELEKKLN